MNRLLLASALLAMTAAASAQSAPPTADADEQERAAATDMTVQGVKDDAFADRLCLRQTGSRIVASRNLQSRDDMRACVAGNGRVYTRADIDATGAINIADALRRLDPAIR